ncbi:MAG: carboxypeptidase-like regulatory domain-containing protein [Segetibacter sp.]
MPQGGAPNGKAGQALPNIGRVYGKLVDSSGKAISDASVMLLHSSFNGANKKPKEVLLKGIGTKANGEFEFEELPVMGTLKLKISATGYKPVEQAVSFMAGRKPGTPSQTSTAGGMGMPSFDKDLGKITLLTDIKQLETVTVTSTSGMRMDIDKKVFSVDKNIVSAGGTALDVMKNVPSVNVDIDGNVALRNSPSANIR